MNAYELADAIEDWDSDGQWDTPAANMLRQQADKISNMEQWEKRYLDKIAELEDKLSFYEIKDLDSGLKPKPLSDEEIKIIATQNRTDLTIPAYISFARAIEERHGIK